MSGKRKLLVPLTICTLTVGSIINDVQVHADQWGKDDFYFIDQDTSRGLHVDTVLRKSVYYETHNDNAKHKSKKRNNGSEIRSDIKLEKSVYYETHNDNPKQPGNSSLQDTTRKSKNVQGNLKQKKQAQKSVEDSIKPLKPMPENNSVRPDKAVMDTVNRNKE